MNEQRRIFDFIMGGCSGFCFFYGDFIGYSIGSLMLVTHIVTVFRDRMLKSLDKSLEEEKQ